MSSRNQGDGEDDTSEESDIDYDSNLFYSASEIWPSKGLERGIMKRFEKDCQVGWLVGWLVG